MIRKFKSFSISDLSETKSQMLSWSNRFNICAFLDNHHYQLPGHSYECLIGCGAVASVKANAGNALHQLQQFLDQQNDWCFGHFGYDLKSETEQLASAHTDRIGFADLHFFIPQYVFQLNENEISIGSFQNDHAEILQQINTQPPASADLKKAIQIKERVSKEEYLRIIGLLQQHILRGDCYELNYCMEFYADDVVIDPRQCYQSLTTISPNPFSAFYKVDHSYLLCASPERFLRKQDNQLLSQPIKGTLKRNLADARADDELKQQLQHSAKDKSENVMVVDLVRNDLSRVCKEGTVKTDELYGIYSFPQVHQMISSVSGELKDDLLFADIIKATFPMGSMTGAPKRKVMQLTEQYEQSRRGLFSGAVGYISPYGDFDFNVVIRSIFYNAATNYLSYMVGSGITFYSDAEQEYEECLLKASAIEHVLT